MIIRSIHNLRLLCIAGIAAFYPAWGFAAGPSTTQLPVSAHPKIALELFTSQGCSSCPPADRVLEKLAQQPNLIALSRPVQYWDQLGWKDTLATPENTNLQYAYAKFWRKSGVYTPQLIVDGIIDVVGNQENTIRQYIEAQEQKKSGVTINSTSQADGSIAVTMSGTATAHTEIHLLWLRASTLVPIGRGENSNSNVRYINSVMAEKIIGEFSGGTQTLVINPQDLRKASSNRWVILIQEPGPGHILGADYIGAETLL